MKRKWKDTKRKLDQVQAEKVMQVEGCIGHWAIAFKIRIREEGRAKFFDYYSPRYPTRFYNTLQDTKVGKIHILLQIQHVL